MIGKPIVRRDFLLSSAGTLLTIPGWRGLPWCLPSDAGSRTAKKRLIIVFSPNGMVTEGFWPTTEGPEFEMDCVLKPLENFRDKTLVVKGICNKVRGDGDNHMRGMSCLLTGNELFPGNIQGGSDTPAGWAKGISIDQEIKNYLQANDHSRTRFGSLEYGVLVHNEANPWTRMVYAGPNQPIPPISDPYRMYDKLHGSIKDREKLMEVLDLVKHDYDRLALSDRELLRRLDAVELLSRNRQYVDDMHEDLRTALQSSGTMVPIQLPVNVPLTSEKMPEIAKMQIDLLVNGFVNDLNRVATLQFTQSVGDVRMRWLEVDEGHHHLSHEPDANESAQEKLRRINTWYCEQIAYLAEQLEKAKEPGSNQSLLDNTLIVWTNELGHGGSHTLANLPMVMVGGGFGFEMGRYTIVDRVSTTRLWLAIAHAMGHEIDSFGLAELCKDGPVVL
ncbi:MAG TPA: DUF1552 domain-containing protein [Pirellulaceae bacterium]|nr:DUF1552 domain-containing protein [Pirellulaceae bacterium]HMO93611.1 DUF1552 domain-containing protein [Pirellulaceae bacterium]HMP70483.1 DUF1552 domain-containing protein [Pirellulaceae bacterium]